MLGSSDGARKVRAAGSPLICQVVGVALHSQGAIER